jgi:hypothetical protein
MGLQVSLITFSPNTTIKSADVNANFQQVLNAANYYGSIGATNNTNTLIEIDDIDITIKNGGHTCHSSRHKHHSGSNDRCQVFSVKTNGVVIDALVIDETGQCHHKHGHHCDGYGNHYTSTSHFSGSGTGTYSHGLVGVTPTMIIVTPNSSTTPISYAVSNVGSSTCKITLSAAVAFDALAVYYSDTD